MKLGNYRIVGVKLNLETRHYERVTVYRDRYAGDDNSASSAKFNLMRRGYATKIFPTPGVWTETLELP